MSILGDATVQVKPTKKQFALKLVIIFTRNPIVLKLDSHLAEFVITIVFLN